MAIPKEISTGQIGNDGAEAFARFLESTNDVGINELNVSVSDIGPRVLGIMRLSQ